MYGDDREGGAATIWALATGLVFVVVAATLAVAGSAIVARNRAQAAADFAALGAAARAWDGASVACARASDLSSRNGAELVACRLEGLDAVVTVEVRAIGAGPWGAARASARAGPVESLTPASTARPVR
jgi:secretion/DNA translocation related TadE-like protein